MNFRMLYWNVAFGQGGDSVVNYGRQADRIAGYNPDVIGLSEIQLSANMKGLLESRLGVPLHSHLATVGTGTPGGPDQANQILSKIAPSFVNQKVYIPGWAQCAIHARITINGTPINFFVTHLHAGSAFYTDPAIDFVGIGEGSNTLDVFDHAPQTPTNDGRRVTQLLHLSNWLAEFATPRIIMGDMNSRPYATEIANMEYYNQDLWKLARTNSVWSEVGWTPTTNGRGSTHIAANQRIDYFFARGNSNPRGMGPLTLVSMNTDHAAAESDHRLITAVLDV